VPSIASETSYVDLNFCDTPKSIATGVYTSNAGVVLVDPGPGSCVATLRAELKKNGITIRDVEAIFLTHIHLDHAGASGTLVEENPKIKVFVHERGAPHLVDPSKLLNSANQLWGVDGVAKLWGPVLPISAQNLTALRGGEHINVAGQQFDVRYTPGHASHHVSYFDARTGVAWVGDTAGLRFGPTLFALAPTPPPDIDLEAWRNSLNLIRAWHPETVFITHFGPHTDAMEHLDQFEQGLLTVADMARSVFESDASEDEKYAQFKADVERFVHRSVPVDETRPYEYVAPLEFNWRGLARYWRRRLQANETLR